MKIAEQAAPPEGDRTSKDEHVAKVAALREEIAEWEGKVADLEKRQQEAQAVAGAAELERQEYVLAALANSDAGAQAKLDDLGAKASGSRQRADDFALAITRAKATIDSLRVRLNRAEALAEAAAIHRLISQRRQVVERIVREVASLHGLMAEASKLDLDITASARNWDARFPDRAHEERWKSLRGLSMPDTELAGGATDRQDLPIQQVVVTLIDGDEFFREYDLRILNHLEATLRAREAAYTAGGAEN